jgi:GntP family gluconate:H+ symporter
MREISRHCSRLSAETSPLGAVKPVLGARVQDVMPRSHRYGDAKIEDLNPPRVPGFRSVLIQQLNNVAIGIGDVDLLDVVVTDARSAHPLQPAFLHCRQERLEGIHHDGKVVAQSRAQFFAVPTGSMTREPAGFRFADYMHFLVGSTIFFDTAVILLAPVTIAVARQSKKSIIFFAVPMAIAVLGMHSIIPPHPGAVAIATALNVNFGLLIMYGLLAMLPGVAIAFLYSQWVARKLTGNGTIDLDAAYDGGGPTKQAGESKTSAPESDPSTGDAPYTGGHSSPVTTAVATATVQSSTLTALEGHERPAVGKLLFVLLLPIVLILIQTLAGSVHIGGPAQTVLDILTFLGTPWLALTITVFFAYVLLLTPRVGRGESISFFGMQGMKPVGEILVSTGGGVAFGSIIGASGVGKQLLDTLADIHLPLVLFGFVLAAILRATLGTTTAAVTFVAVLLAQAFDTTSLNPSQLALLAVGVSAGGMCLSNFNDAGFWVLSRYFGISEQVMLKTWTAGVTIMGCVTATIASLLWLAVS